MRAIDTDQGKAIPVRIEFLLNRYDLIDALAYSVRNDGEDALPALSNTAVVERVRDTLFEAGGLNYHYWSDHMDDDREQEVGDWATALVTRVYGSALPEEA